MPDFDTFSALDHKGKSGKLRILIIFCLGSQRKRLEIPYFDHFLPWIAKEIVGITDFDHFSALDRKGKVWESRILIIFCLASQREILGIPDFDPFTALAHKGKVWGFRILIIFCFGSQRKSLGIPDFGHFCLGSRKL